MKRFRLLSALLSFAVGVSICQSAMADGWMPSWLASKTTTSKVSTASGKKAKPKTSSVSNKSSSPGLLTSTKNLFVPQPKSKVVSKWPSQTSSKSKPKASSAPKKDSWVASMFKPKEPEPPRSIGEWMDLKQIKP